MGFYRKESNARVFTKVDTIGFWELFLTRILQISKKQVQEEFREVYLEKNQ
jgi:purine nucleosidase